MKDAKLFLSTSIKSFACLSLCFLYSIIIKANQFSPYSSKFGYISNKEFIQNPSLEKSILKQARSSSTACEPKEYSHFSICSFTRIDKDIVATAGHCIENLYHDRVQKKNLEKLKNFVFVFPDSDSSKLRYFDKLLFFRSIPRHFDLAAIQLKPESTTTRDEKNEPKSSNSIAPSKNNYILLGFPLHSPLRVELTAEPLSNYTSRTFSLPIHSFQGNSGAPLFDVKIAKLLGINISGTPDMKYDSAKKCYRHLTKSEKEASLSLFQSIEGIQEANFNIQNTFEDEIHSLVQYQLKFNNVNQDSLPTSLIAIQNTLHNLKDDLNDLNEIIASQNISTNSIIKAYEYANKFKHEKLTSFLKKILLQRRKNEILSSHFNAGPSYEF